jgi:predicted ester cyclase
MTSLDSAAELMARADRNKTNYLNAKAAFNRNDIDACIAYYAVDHQIMSAPHQTWPDIQIVVEHAVAEGDWVMGRSVTTATHTTAMFGVQPTHKRIETTFWDLHRFNHEGLIVETWNLRDNLAVMAQLGLMPAAK